MESDELQEAKVLTKQHRIAENAKRLPKVSFTSLAYPIAGQKPAL